MSDGEHMLRRWLKAVGKGEPIAMLAASLVGLLVLLSPFAFMYGQKWFKIFRFDAGGEASRGTPPFRSWNDWYAEHRDKPVSHRDLNSRYKIAALDFLETASCLEDGVTPSSRESLERMDWERLDNAIEAEVCVFRILATVGKASEAAKWMQSQGLTMVDGSQVRPWPDNVGNLIVSGSWDIREKGYKHIDGGIVLHLIGPPYAMSVYSSWTEDGERLQYVDVGFNTK